LLPVLALVLGACGEEEDHGPVRNPGGGGGGGGGGSSDGGDADAGVDGALAELRGRICIVTDLRLPVVCPDVAARVGVAVRETLTGTATTSGSDGSFTVQTTGAAAQLAIATGSTTLVPSTVPLALPVADGVAEAPVIGTADWQAVLDAIVQTQPDGRGAVVVYVADAAGPVVGAEFDNVTGSTVAPFYDAGGALAWAQGVGTGSQGVALFLDVPAGTIGLAATTPASGTVTVADLPVVADAITFVHVRPTPP
jgi:hypothetical protein